MKTDSETNYANSGHIICLANLAIVFPTCHATPTGYLSGFGV